ncbi:MAG: DUF2269 domain-containing protein [Methylotenera sp.]|nr:MAG: DUF2269 domain-containing protein [Methylotenera sp.]
MDIYHTLLLHDNDVSMNIYLIVKTIHIISSTVLFGTGLGIAFFMFRSYFTDNLQEKLYAAKGTVIADYVFTFPAVITQLVTGVWLVWKSGYHWTEFWLTVTYAIFIAAGFCWLPVVWIQVRLRNILLECVENKTTIPNQYVKLFRIWFLLGWPAFIGLIVVFFMMVTKPI